MLCLHIWLVRKDFHNRTKRCKMFGWKHGINTNLYYFSWCQHYVYTPSWLWKVFSKPFAPKAPNILKNTEWKTRLFKTCSLFLALLPTHSNNTQIWLKSKTDIYFDMLSTNGWMQMDTAIFYMDTTIRLTSSFLQYLKLHNLIT